MAHGPRPCSRPPTLSPRLRRTTDPSSPQERGRVGRTTATSPNIWRATTPASSPLWSTQSSPWYVHVCATVWPAGTELIFPSPSRHLMDHTLLWINLILRGWAGPPGLPIATKGAGPPISDTTRAAAKTAAAPETPVPTILGTHRWALNMVGTIYGGHYIWWGIKYSRSTSARESRIIMLI